MEATIQHVTANQVTRKSQPSLSKSFINWCNCQEKYRFGWLAAILAIHGCILTPITIFAITLSGVHIAMFILAIAAMGMALVTNLAAMPVKVTIPVFFFSVLIDLSLIIAAISMAV